MDNTPNDEISALKLQIFELKAAIICASIRVRAFEEFVEKAWAKRHPNEPRGIQFHKALRELERAVANRALAEYADKDPTMATILKKYADREFPRTS